MRRKRLLVQGAGGARPVAKKATRRDHVLRPLVRKASLGAQYRGVVTLALVSVAPVSFLLRRSLSVAPLSLLLRRSRVASWRGLRCRGAGAPPPRAVARSFCRASMCAAARLTRSFGHYAVGGALVAAHTVAPTRATRVLGSYARGGGTPAPVRFGFPRRSDRRCTGGGSDVDASAVAHEKKQSPNVALGCLS